MRINVYAEEITDRVELVCKGEFTGVRFYLELPVALSTPPAKLGEQPGVAHIRGPFVHKPGDDDSAAVTFWGKRAFKAAMIRALQLIDANETPVTAAELGRATNRLNEVIQKSGPSKDHVKAAVFSAMHGGIGPEVYGRREEIEKVIDSVFGGGK